MKLLPIETERLKFRLVEKTDVEEIFSLLHDERIVKYLNMERHLTIDDTNKLLDEYFDGLIDYSKIPYYVMDKTDNAFIGVLLLKVDLYNVSSYEMTIYLKKEYWGKGYAKEMISSIYSIIFDELGIKNLRGYIMENNIASSKVLENLGFELEKIFKVDGIDGLIKSYLLTVDDYKNKTV